MTAGRAVAFTLVLLSLACVPGATPAEKAVETLAVREKALNARDLDLYMTTIAPGYGGSATGPAAIRARASRLFEGIDAIRYSTDERSVYEEPDGRVRVIQRFVMELEREGVRRNLAGREEIFLTPLDGRMLIVDGL